MCGVTSQGRRRVPRFSTRQMAFPLGSPLVSETRKMSYDVLYQSSTLLWERLSIKPLRLSGRTPENTRNICCTAIVLPRARRTCHVTAARFGCVYDACPVAQPAWCR